MNKWMKIAYEEAITGMSANHGGPFGAVIIKDNKVIAAAHNQVLKSKDPTAHAEINVIRKASKILNNFDLSDCTLYTTCQPCPMCLGAIFWARIKVVYYGATKADAAKGGFDDHRFYEMMAGKNNEVSLKQIDHQENAELFQQWNKKTDAQQY
ncbi:MAG: nucleoside deaminase [Proteobacteria bacterium]|nr:nucleoside deaminase [Pseudomonadota bacterium]